MSRSYRIAYIVGLQHCGSTLLDLLLNAHSEAVSVGELFELHEYAHELKPKTEQTRFGSSCTCGADSIWDCAFWQAINDQVERRSGLTLRELDLRAGDPVRFADHNRLFFDSLADVTGAKLIVDSSKRFHRLAGLLQYTDLPVTPIHLLRDPKGQIYSLVKRGKGSVLGPASYYRQTTLKTLRLLREVESIRLRYENLVADPEPNLNEVMLSLGLDYQRSQLNWAEAERHNLAGNRMRRTSSSAITVKDEWREKLGLSRQAMITMLTLPATYATRHY